MSEETDNSNVGRPTKYKPEYCEQAEKLIRLGATDRQLAEFFCVHESTLHLWKLTHTEFSESIKRTKEEVDEQVEQSLYQRAMGYSHKEEKIFNNNGEIVRAETIRHYPPDSTALIFWLKNRKPAEWRDKRELVGKDGEALFPEASDLELARRMALILQKGEQEATKH